MKPSCSTDNDPVAGETPAGLCRLTRREFATGLAGLAGGLFLQGGAFFQARSGAREDT